MGVRTIEANGLRFPALEAGADGRPLLIVHGFVGAKEDWVGSLERLAAAGHHVVVPDLRGHGAGPKPAARDAYSLRHYTADVIAIADALGWDRLTLLGHSMGGMVAQHVALEHPHRLDALILQDTSHGVPDGIDPALVELGTATVAEGGTEALVAVQTEAGIEGPFDTPAHQRLCETVPGYRERGDHNTRVAADAMWLAMVDELLSQPDRLEQLGTLAMPTLVIAGLQDQAFIEHCRRMAAVIPGAHLVVIDDAGHSPHNEMPDEWWSAVADFLQLANLRQ
jgi:pimeloyl-ACP methyl ester carboxylesterase